MNSNQIQALILLGTKQAADDRSVAALERLGYVNATGDLTPVGISAYLDNVDTRDVYTLVLGTTLSGIKVGKRAYTIHKGAVLIALFAGRTKNQKWYDCYYAEGYPIIRVLHHSSHEISITRVPLTELADGIGQHLPTVS